MKFSVHVLGSGSALPTVKRGPSAQVVNLHGKPMLVDCGEGTQLRLRQNKIKMQQITHLFISHLHGDHFFGLVGLISTLHLLGRTKPMYVYAPEGLEKVIREQFKLSSTYLQFELNFVVLKKNQMDLLIDEENYHVYSFPVEHSIPTWGFLFKEKPLRVKLKKSFIESHRPDVGWIKRIIDGEDYVNEAGERFLNTDITHPPREAVSYAYCSDTRYAESIIEYIKGATLLYHEASFANDLRSQAKARFHSTAGQAAMIAQKAAVKQLMIGHFSARYKKDITCLLLEAQTVFENTIAAEDGKCVVLAD